MLDCGTQARTWELLRLTRMPAVRVEIGYLSNMGDRRRLLDPAFRDVVAEGMLVGGQAAVPAGAGRPADRHVHFLATCWPASWPVRRPARRFPVAARRSLRPAPDHRQRPLRRALRRAAAARGAGSVPDGGPLLEARWTAAER